MKILLIAGHGAGDCGAVGCGCQEADLTREMVALIKPKLDNYATVEIADTSANWYNSKTKLPLSGVDYALEIHFNACVNDAKGNGKTTGTEIYVTTSENGVTVEESIVGNIANLGLKNRGVKRKNWAVINYIKKQGISSALLETCFIDDADDMAIYQAKKDDIAQAVANGIIAGFKLGEAKSAPITATKPQPIPTYTPQAFQPYLVKITASVLNVRKGVGTAYPVATTVRRGGVYTIVEERNGWGRLKSGVGWIKLSYTTKV
jgi:hypothetical protein